MTTLAEHIAVLERLVCELPRGGERSDALRVLLTKVDYLEHQLADSRAEVAGLGHAALAHDGTMRMMRSMARQDGWEPNGAGPVAFMHWLREQRDTERAARVRAEEACGVAREALRFLKSYLGHEGQDANTDFMAAKVIDALALLEEPGRVAQASTDHPRDTQGEERASGSAFVEASAVEASANESPVAIRSSQPDGAAGGPRLFFIQDTRTYCGNNVCWWCADSNGYTYHLEDAGKYTLDEAQKATQRLTDILWPVELIESLRFTYVDMQRLRGLEHLGFSVRRPPPSSIRESSAASSGDEDKPHPPGTTEGETT